MEALGYTLLKPAELLKQRRLEFIHSIPLNIDDSVYEIENTLRQHGVRLQSRVGGLPYMVDRHFADYVLRDVYTMQDVDTILQRLDNWANYLGHSRCAKAQTARAWFYGQNGGFWQETPEKMRTALAASRLTCCICHETGSFHQDTRWSK